jgi:hypothetical protein
MVYHARGCSERGDTMVVIGWCWLCVKVCCCVELFTMHGGLHEVVCRIRGILRWWFVCSSCVKCWPCEAEAVRDGTMGD